MENSDTIKKILADPTIRRFVWLARAGSLLLGILLILLSLVVKGLVLRVIFFAPGSIIVSSVILGTLNKYLYFRIPGKYLKRFAFFVGVWLTLGLHIVPSEIFRWYVIGGTALVFLILPTVSGICWLFVDRFLPWSIFKDYARGWRGARWGSMGYSLYEPGIASRYGHRIIREFHTAIALFGGKQAFLFFDANSFHRYPSDFERTIVSRVPAIAVFKKASKDNLQSEFENRIADSIKLSTGRIYFIFVTPFGEGFSPVQTGKGIEAFSFTPSTQEGERADIADFVSKLNTQLSTAVIPLGDSDDDLTSELKPLIQDIALYGVPLISNCYLRFRLSQSNVERYFCLLDCVEVLIKTSTIYFLTNQWKCNKPTESYSKQFEQPVLGTWIRILKKSINGSDMDQLKKNVSESLHQTIGDPQKKLFEDANNLGLAYQKELPRDNLEWLDWLRLLRNVTRGHGAVEENQITPLWHGLHESFLHLVSCLKPLVLDSVITTTSSRSRSVLRGWTREIDAGIRDFKSDQVPYEPAYLADKKNNGRHEQILLYPFVVKVSDSLLIWNSVRGNTVEFIDYGSGQLLCLPLPSTNPYELWNNTVSSV